MRALLVAIVVLLAAGSASAQRVDGVVDLAGNKVDVFPKAVSEHGPAEQLLHTTFIFATTDCPISRRYAPEVRRLGNHYRAPVLSQLWLVFPVPSDTRDPERIRRHLVDFDYGIPVILDTKHKLVKMTGVTMTPEAAVLNAKKRVVYRGRIDDRYIEIGNYRLIPTARDLEDVLKLAVVGEPIKPRQTQAVGCYLSDLLK